MAFDDDTCPYCNGKGYVTADCTMEYDRYGNLDYVKSRCWYCEGYGYA